MEDKIREKIVYRIDGYWNLFTIGQKVEIEAKDKMTNRPEI